MVTHAKSTSARSPQYASLLTAMLCACSLFASAQDIPDTPIEPLTNEPVGFIGHGALFDTAGREINSNIRALDSIVAYYQRELDRVMSAPERTAHAGVRTRAQRLLGGDSADDILPRENRRLLVEALLLTDQLNRFNPADGGRLQGIATLIQRKAVEAVGAMDRQVLQDQLAQSPFFNGVREIFGGGQDIGPGVLFSTLNAGAAYLAECIAAGVPEPPDWGSADWTPTGELANSEEFISRSEVAKPHIFNSTSPEGACIALPRVNNANTSISLLGIICVGKATGNACFWDNQEFMAGGSTVGDATVNFPIPVGTDVPLSDFFGGAALVGGGGGRCSHCHAGENPFVIHPGTALGRPALDADGDLQKMPMRFHIPLVHPDWYQNEFTSTLVDEPEASECSGCHSNDSDGSLSNSRAGRFPKLTTDIRFEYCEAVIKNAINIAASDPANTMPMGGTLSTSDHAALVDVIDDFCTNGTDPGLDAGDPHLTTTNGVRYDFQAAGEFVLLKDRASFVVQARQTPIATSFFPGANAHTGIASCASINTAVAARVGDTRVTFQPGLDGIANPAGMELRIDGVETPLTSSGIGLPDGGMVRRSGVGGLEIEFPNGEYLSAVPGFWTSQGHWFLDITIADAEARGGIMGPIPNGSWLPRLPDGTSLGARPASVLDRYNVLNGTFANAWRVTERNSLFDYAPGQGPASFDFPGWPKTAPDCEVPDQTAPPRASAAAARAACAAIRDPDDRANCEFDFELTGAGVFPEVYERAERQREGATRTRIIVVAGRGLPQAERTYGVHVAPRWQDGLKRHPEGSVQIAVDGATVGALRPLDAAGIAYFNGSEVEGRDGPVTATFTPSPGSSYLPGATGPTDLDAVPGLGPVNGAAGGMADKPPRPTRLELICIIILLLIIVFLLLVLRRP